MCLSLHVGYLVERTDSWHRSTRHMLPTMRFVVCSVASSSAAAFLVTPMRQLGNDGSVLCKCQRSIRLAWSNRWGTGMQASQNIH